MSAPPPHQRPPTNPPLQTPLFRFLLLRWCESTLGSKGKQKKEKTAGRHGNPGAHAHTHTGDVWAAYGPGERGGYVSVCGV